MGLTLVTPASEWPVTLDEAKEQCGIRHSDSDDHLTRLIKEATAYVEKTLSLSIAEQTWKLTLDEFSDAIELLRGPVTSVSGVQYYDADGVTQTADTVLYTADLVSSRQWLVLNSGASWPSVLDGVNAVSVTYTAGMEVIPDDLKGAILLKIQLLFERFADPRVSEAIERAIADLLQSYRAVLV